jgi:hypothetical protein
MDIVAIGAMTVSILVSFFKDALSETAKSSVKELFEFIKSKIGGNNSDKIQKLEKTPDDKNAQQEFQKLIEAKMKADTEFTQKLLEKLDSLSQNKEDVIFKNVITGNPEKINIVQVKNNFGDIEL